MTRTRTKSGSLPAAIEFLSIPSASSNSKRAHSSTRKAAAKRKRPSESSTSSVLKPPTKKRLVAKKPAELIAIGSPPSEHSSSEDECIDLPIAKQPLMNSIPMMIPTLGASSPCPRSPEYIFPPSSPVFSPRYTPDSSPRFSPDTPDFSPVRYQTNILSSPVLRQPVPDPMIDFPSNLHLSDVTESYIESPMPSFIAPRSYANRKSAASETSYSILLERMEKLEQRDAARQEQFDKQERQLDTQERKIADLHLQVASLRHQNSELRTGAVEETYQTLPLNGKLPLKPTDLLHLQTTSTSSLLMISQTLHSTRTIGI